MSMSTQVGIFLSSHERSFCSQDRKVLGNFLEEIMTDDTMWLLLDRERIYPLISLSLLVQNLF